MRGVRDEGTEEGGMFLCQNWCILETIFYQLWHIC